MVQAHRGPPRPRRGARTSSTPTTTTWRRSSSASSSTSRCASWRRNKKGPILCLVGPPGVGKTSLGKSIARALGREFVRISLGGVRDEAEIRGHRRTYIGALPGRIIQGMKRAGTHNPVFMLDEIDKLGADFRGDPSAALLEVLDPEQNNSFTDHYLEVPFDLSEVIFIATANDLSPIPPALRDRMEVLELPGYTRAREARRSRTQVPRAQAARRARADRATTSTLTRPGARRDHRALHARGGRAQPRARARHRHPRRRGQGGVGRDLLAASSAPARSPSYLGPAQVLQRDRRAHRASRASPPAWPGRRRAATSCSSRSTRMPGKGNLVLTGQLGAVMKESAQAALSYVRAHAARARHRGRLPREERPAPARARRARSRRTARRRATRSSSALVSLLTGRRVRGDVAMTGEITLRGNVLPVGGIKEKVLAAHRAGIKRVILPERNAQGSGRAARRGQADDGDRAGQKGSGDHRRGIGERNGRADAAADARGSGAADQRLILPRHFGSLLLGMHTLPIDVPT